MTLPPMYETLKIQIHFKNPILDELKNAPVGLLSVECKPLDCLHCFFKGLQSDKKSKH